MRRMRDLQWRDYLVVAAAIAAAFGVHALYRSYVSDGGRDAHLAMKPSSFFPDGGEKRKDHGAYANRDGEMQRLADDLLAAAPGGPSAHVVGELPRHLLSETIYGSADAPGTGACEPVEFRGDGPLHTRIGAKSWQKVIGQFHEVKSGLLAWLNANKKTIPFETAERMEKAIRELRIQRPPLAEEPDMNWRGLVALVPDAAGNPILRVGGGFVHLLDKLPKRSRFELARAVAQAWAPCELERIGAAQPWSPLMKCLGIDASEATRCGQGTFSEAGWAVSTSVAAFLAPPGCTVPAFNGDAGECVKQIRIGAPSATEHVSIQAKDDHV